MARYAICALLSLCPVCFSIINANELANIETSSILSFSQSWTHKGRQTSKLSALLEFEYNFEKAGAFTAIIRTQFVGPNALEPGKFTQPSVSPASQALYANDSLEVELREFYWDYDLDLAGKLLGDSTDASIRIGKQQVVWGQADGLKLLDVINPQNFREFILEDFNDSRIPSWMINLEMFFGFGDIQFLWIPDTSMHSLPGPGSTFEITAPFANLPKNLTYFIDPIDRPDNLFDDSDIGLRLSMFKSGWDITFNYLYHYDDFPVIRKQLTQSGLRLTPSYERTHTFGASASNAFGSFVVRTELVLNTDKFIPLNAISASEGIGRTRELAYVLGLDWSGLSDTFISLQVFQSFLLDANDFARARTDTNMTFLARRNFLNESLKLELLYIYHNNDSDSLLRIRADYELSSQWIISVFGDIFQGKADTLFGQFNARDQVGIKFKFSL